MAMGEKPDPEFDRLWNTTAHLLPHSHDILAIRDQIEIAKRQYEAARGSSLDVVDEFDLEMTKRDGTQLTARVYRVCRESKAGIPAAIFLCFHGGGYCIGSCRDEAETNRRLSASLNLIVVSVEYRLAPEHPFPACLYDSLESLHWIESNKSSLGAAPSARLIVGGISSGGNIANALIYMNRDSGSPIPVAGQFLSVSNIIPPPVVPTKYKKHYQSIDSNQQYAIPPKELVGTFLSAYKPDLNSPLFVPFNNPKGHHGIPPTFFQVCGLDPLRDEELIYERVLREEYGTLTRPDYYPGLPHHFWEFFPQLSEQKERRIQETVSGFQWLLEIGGK